MGNIPKDLKYSNSHEWVKTIDENTAIIGISHFAQSSLGDIVFIELPELNKSFEQNSETAVVESVKAASDIYTPVSGEIIEVNNHLEDAPETVNSDPYGDGWLFKIKMSNNKELDDLLDAEQYKNLTE